MKLKTFVLLLVPIAILSALVSAGGQQTTADDPCNWKPAQGKSIKPLEGTYGTSSDVYYFRHVSDMDDDHGIFNYQYILTNLHGSRVLPAEWKAVGLYFRQIPCCGQCGLNSFNSTRKFSERDAPIKYGPASQFTKTARAYLASQQAVKAGGEAAADKHPALTSRVFVAGIDKSQRIDITFKSEVEDGRYTYTVVNNGTLPVNYAIPSLTEAFEKFGAELPWRSAGDQVYSAEPSFKQFARISAPGNRPGEHTFFIYVGTSEFTSARRAPRRELSVEDRGVLARGRVSLYVPSVR
jgi:hypothetical protein